MPASNVVEGEPIETAWGNDVADAITALELHPTDTTAVHGIADTSTLYRAGGTDVAIADGGTGASSAAAAATALGLGTASNPQFATIELGAASDTTLSRASAGVLAVEGKAAYLAGGTDVAIADGGTGASTAAAARAALGLAMTVAELQRVACSGDLTLTTTATDIPGATVTMTAVAGDTFVCVGVFDMQVTTLTAATNALGTLVANGVAQAGLSIVSCESVKRSSGAQVWIVTGLAAGARTFKLQGNISASGPVVASKATHTTLTVVRLQAA